MLYKKSGQFFLVAALIIILIVFSFGTVYNQANVPSSDSSKYSSLASEIKSESVDVVNQGVYDNLSYNNISSNLFTLVSNYSTLYPTDKIILLYGSTYSPSSFGAEEFSNGVGTIIAYTNNGNFTVVLNNVSYSATILKGYNTYIIVQSEEENERYISEA